MTERVYSFEFFPPKTPDGEARLEDTHRRLAALGPHYVSVTFGAGGSTREHTLETVLKLRAAGADTAPHISCIASGRAELAALIDTYRSHGVRRLVALRGDMPSGAYEPGEFQHAVDLVRFIREISGDHFHVEVAAYPEVHPQARDYDTDLAHFVEKVAAGADGAITQYFYNADAYFYFVERARRLGVEVPIVPGIMPITNLARLARFSAACGAEIPRWILRRLEAIENDEAAVRDFGVEVVARLCERLLAGGAPGLHFYTLNQAEPTATLWRWLGLPHR